MRRVPVSLLVVGALAFANAGVWSLVTPAFHGPDEDAHVAYADHLAQTGDVPDAGGGKPFASTELRRALGATHHHSAIFATVDARPPWMVSDERDFERATAAGRAPRDDGGGRTGASENAPVFYAVPALASRLGGGIFDRLLWMRLACALLAGLAAAFVAAAVRELLPGAPWAAPAAGLAVGFQPGFGFVNGTVNPDAGAAAAGALLLYLLVRALRRGLTPRLGAGIGAVLVVGSLAKLSVLALAPAVVLAAVVLWRRGSASRPALAALAGTAAALAGAWALVAAQLDRERLPGAGGQATFPLPGEPAADPVGILDRVSYLWQVFLPPLPFMEDLYTGDDPVPAWTFYVERAWGSFGWLNVNLPDGAFALIALAMALGVVLAAVGAWRERAAVRSRWAEIAVLGVAFVGVAAAAHLNFGRAQPLDYMLEQGRYLFPAATAVAVLAIGACFAFGRRWAPVLATVLVAAMATLSGLCQLFVFTAYYT